MLVSSRHYDVGMKDAGSGQSLPREQIQASSRPIYLASHHRRYDPPAQDLHSHG